MPDAASRPRVEIFTSHREAPSENDLVDRLSA
jgi:hypothetical protein